MKILRFLRTLSIVSSLLLVVACQNPKTADTPPPGSSPGPEPKPRIDLVEKPNTVRIMAYNVENLFDNVDDPGKDEGEFNSWTSDEINLKLRNLSDSILQIDGVGPDILLLEEVENMNILKMLNSALAKANYQTAVLEEGLDERGIDTAVLSRYAQAAPAVLHQIPFPPEADGKPFLSRGILEVILKLPNNSILHVFAVHFPSLANASVYRKAAFDEITRLIKAVPENHLFVVGGDFNVSVEEEAKNSFYKEFSKHGILSHQVGCRQCQGTHYYKGEWSFLDAMLFSPNLNAGARQFNKSLNKQYQLDASTIRTPDKGKYQMKDGLPVRSRKGSELGVSDHMPLYAEIKLN